MKMKVIIDVRIQLSQVTLTMVLNDFMLSLCWVALNGLPKYDCVLNTLLSISLQPSVGLDGAIHWNQGNVRTAFGDSNPDCNALWNFDVYIPVT
ncbi:hypothetical protein VNO77_44548 [Canavalia gladiata]|uniref:Uncharacterized protein n=1 Tax=Canavalia gladiata TaxID=3824 RepID=A0AAN9JYB7_CANGL